MSKFAIVMAQSGFFLQALHTFAVASPEPTRRWFTNTVHYGYVGRAGGLSESVLLDGAGGEQIISDALRKAQEVVTKPREQWELPGPNRSANVDGLRAWDDAPDRISISVGVNLYRQHPNRGITAKMIMDQVLAVPPKEWGKGIKLHECK